MRNGQNNNNKRLRNRNNNNSNNNNNNNNNNRRGQNPMTRVFESNGPDIKIRGTASHVAEKYVQLARDARSSGDPVAAENYYQHAEHYFRLIAAAQEQFRQNLPQQRTDNEMQDDSGEFGDGESYSNFGAEPGLVPVQPQPFVPREPQQQRDQQPREQQRDAQPYQPREQREPREQQQPREHQSRDHQPREHRPQPQPQYQPQPQPVIPVSDSVDRLPSFITGPQPQISGAPGFEGTGGERFPPRRRRRPPGPRPEGAAAPAAPADDFNPGNE
ncbi:DUF4167 domain-containing protein [Rhodopseudomonas palustris]|uniref:DUF4167 domain-containing protein n=1 Tax=Rhodopseudomonas palustris (strain BisB18) TaxID=316056 RepID=Q21C01_RHOPB